MECNFPPPLSAVQLAQAIEGLADPMVQDHLAHCPGCAQRMAEARQVDRTLAQALLRWDCPSPDDLRDYHLKLFDAPEQTNAVVAHLQFCPRCTTELAELQAFLAAELDLAPLPAPAAPAVRPAWPSLGRWLRERIAQIAPRAPALALRGTMRQPIIATVDDVTVILELDPQADGSVRLIGQLIAAEQPERWLDGLVELWQAGGLVAATTLDAAGGFSCPARADSPATLRISPSSGPTVVVPEIALEAAPD